VSETFSSRKAHNFLLCRTTAVMQQLILLAFRWKGRISQNARQQKMKSKSGQYAAKKGQAVESVVA
jgi:hypothetical protein